MGDPSRVHMTGPLEPQASGFAAELSRQGYTRVSAAFQLQLMAHLSRWLASENLESRGLSAVVVERFLDARRAAGYTNYRSIKALRPLLEYLRDRGAAPLPAAEAPTSPGAVLLERYRHYLAIERGLAPSTVRGYLDALRPFVAGRMGAEGLALAPLTSKDISAFVVAACPGRAQGSAKLVVTALRSLLSFLHLDGVTARSLVAAVPKVASWRLAGLPRALDPLQVRRLLGSCDRRTTTGRRDFALLTLLARMGLRAGEGAALALDDIDWRSGELVVRGKGNRSERLPLPADVGEALADYLRRGRPRTGVGRAVFVRIKAPHRALSSSGVSGVVAAAGRRAGLGVLSAHRLRHTAATAMLRAGAPLAEIGQVLRHHRALSTAIYAKVDRGALRLLARPWPGDAA